MNDFTGSLLPNYKYRWDYSYLPKPTAEKRVKPNTRPARQLAQAKRDRHADPVTLPPLPWEKEFTPSRG